MENLEWMLGHPEEFAFAAQGAQRNGCAEEDPAQRRPEARMVAGEMDDAGADGGLSAAEGENSGARAFTQADIDRIVQRTIWSERQRAERLIGEAREKANLDAEEQACAEKARLEGEILAREAEILAREAEIRRRELRAGALERLADRGLPRELAEVLDYSGEEGMLASIDGMEKAFRSAVQRSVEERLRGLQLPGRSAPVAADLSRLSDEEYYRKVLKKE